MANQRMYIACVRCAEDDSVSLEDSIFYLVKYYPTTGWYLPGDPSKLGPRLDDWFDKHKVHADTMDGRDFKLTYDGLFEPMAISRDAIADAVSRASARKP